MVRAFVVAKSSGWERGGMGQRNSGLAMRERAGKRREGRLGSAVLDLLEDYGTAACSPGST